MLLDFAVSIGVVVELAVAVAGSVVAVVVAEPVVGCVVARQPMECYE